MPRITDVVALAGAVERCVIARSETLSSHYGYMLNGSAPHCQPFEIDGRDVGEAELRPYQAEGLVSSFDPGTFACDAAIEAGRMLIQRGEAPQDIKGLIYCHSAIDECNEWVPATRVAKELRLVDPLCFSVSQVSHCGIFYGLKFLGSQMLVDSDLEKVMLVAADKWLYPFFRGYGEMGTIGDGAGALLLARESGGGGAAIVRVDLAPADLETSLFSRPPDAVDISRLAARAAELIGTCLARAGTTPDSIDCFVPPSGPDAVVREVGRHLGIDEARCVDPGEEGHLSAADPLNMLTRGWAQVAREGARSLWWTCGLNGEIACALLEGARPVEPEPGS